MNCLKMMMAATLGVSVVAYSADVSWNGEKKNGTFSLNDAQNWQGGAVPGADDAAVFNAAWNGVDTTFTASSDLAFKTLKINPPNGMGSATYTFDLGGNKITLSGSGVNTSSTLMFQASNSGGLNGVTLRVTNGSIEGLSVKDPFKYHMSNVLQQNLKIFVDGPNAELKMDAFKFAAKDSLFCVTNGAYVQGALIMSQVDNFKNKVHVTGEGSMWNFHTNRVMTIDGTTLNGPVRLAAVDYGSGGYRNEAVLRVDDGGVVTNFCGRIGGSESCARFEIDNATLYARGDSAMGLNNTSTNNSIIVSNGGLWQGLDDASLVVGNSGSSNALKVSGNGSRVHFRKSLIVGQNSSAKGNLVEVSDGGLLKCTVGCRVGSNGSENGLIVKGAGSRAEFSDLTYVGTSASAKGNYIDVSDGGCLYGGGGSGVFYANFNHGRITVRDGGKIDAAQLTLGMSAGTDCHTNRLEILGAGSEVACRNLMTVNGYGNSLTISNGLLRVDGRIRFNDKAYFDATVNLEGSNPRIQSANYTNKNTTLVFKIPEGGFADGPRIKVSGDMFVDDTCGIVIDAAGRATKKMTLIECGVPHIANSVVSGATICGRYAALYSLAKSDDGKKVFLKVSNGTVIVVR